MVAPSMISNIQAILHHYASFCVQALLHACIACSLKPSVDWIAASDLEDDSAVLVLSSYKLHYWRDLCYISSEEFVLL